MLDLQIQQLIKKHLNEERKRPFVVGVMADLSDSTDAVQSSIFFRDVTRETFPNFMSIIAPKININETTDMSKPDIQQQLATWNGLNYLIHTLPDNKIRVRVMDISKKKLHKHLRKYKGVSWDHSPLFKKIYEDECASFGGQPFDLMIGDYEFSHEAPDVVLLNMISQIMAASHCVFLSSISPMLLGVSTAQGFADLNEPSRLFYGTSYAGWRSLCENSDTRYIFLFTPHTCIDKPVAISVNPAYVIAGKLLGEFSEHRCYGKYFTEVKRHQKHDQVNVNTYPILNDALCSDLKNIGLMCFDQAGFIDSSCVENLRSLYHGNGRDGGALNDEGASLPSLMLSNRVAYSLLSWRRVIAGLFQNDLDYRNAILMRVIEEVLPINDEKVSLETLLERPFSSIDLQFKDIDEYTKSHHEEWRIIFKATSFHPWGSGEYSIFENIAKRNKELHSDEEELLDVHFDLSYPVSLYGEERKVSCPFVTGVIADFISASSPYEKLADRKFLEIDVDNFDDRLKQQAPSIRVAIPTEFSTEDKTIQISFSCLGDFSPISLALRLPYLKNDFYIRENFAELRDKLTVIPELFESVKFLLSSSCFSNVEQPIELSNGEWLEDVKIDSESEELVAQLKTIDSNIYHSVRLISLLSWEAHTEMDSNEHLLGYLNKRIDALDERFVRGVEPVLHNEQFQTLEAVWRGLYLLVVHPNSETAQTRVRFLHLSKQELTEDIKNSFRVLKQKCYDEEFLSFGGEPYGQLISDYGFTSSLSGLKLLKKFAELGEMIKCPVLATMNQQFLELDKHEVENEKDGFWEAWNEFRYSPVTKYVAAVCAKVRGRPYYSQSGKYPADFAYKESVKENTGSYVNGAFGIASEVINKYKKQNWFQAVTKIPQAHYFFDKPTNIAASVYVDSDDLGVLVLKNHADRPEYQVYRSLFKKRAKADEQSNLLNSFIITYICRTIMCRWRDTRVEKKTKLEATYQMNEWLQQYVHEEIIPTIQKPFKLIFLEPLRDESDTYYSFKLSLIPAYKDSKETLLSISIDLQI